MLLSRPVSTLRPQSCNRLALLLAVPLWLLTLAGCQSLEVQKTTDTAQAATLTPEPATPNVHTAPEPTPETAADLWSRLRLGMALELDRQEPRVEAQLNYYVRHPAYLARVGQRAERYLHYILSEAEKRQMPTEMALLPVVESAYDPFAYSFGRASGLWQFIPSTGRYFGLEQNWWYDGRRDVIASTEAALNYLQHYYERFGDWELALAAYNAGGGTVNRAIRRNREAGKPTDFWSLQLPKETRAYVPKLLAISRLVRDAEAFGIELPPLANQPYFVAVDTGQQIDLAQAARLADTPLDLVYQLNPGFNRWATAPKGPHRLLIPVDKAPGFSRALSQLSPDERLEWARYTVKAGDSLSRIAKQHHTTSALIRDVNQMQSDRIRAGATLLIPKPTGDLASYRLTAKQRQLAKQQRAQSGRTKHLHQVKSGESFWSLSRRYGVSVRELASWNAMAPGDPLRAGQQLIVWKAGADTRVQGSNTTRKVRYTIRKGDSLAGIASRFNVPLTSVKNWNQQLASSRYLQPGQTLTLYVDVTGTSH